MASDARALATWLAAREDAALATTLSYRGISPHAHWSNFFDAAEALLDSTSIDRTLRQLDRATLALLADAPDASDAPATPRHDEDQPALARAEAFALISPDGIPYSAVASAVRSLRAAAPTAFERPPAPRTPQPADEAQTAAAAERAFAASGSLADVLLACLHALFSRTGTGTVSAADRKRLIDAGAVQSADELEDALLAAASAGLVRAGERLWSVSADGEAWLESSTVARWSRVITGIRDGLPADLRTSSGGVVDITLWPSIRPLDPEWPALAERYRRIAEHWGVIDHSGAEPRWTTPLREGGAVDTDALAGVLTTEIDRVYLQADLTAIAPGPLQPALDLRLRSIAHRESRAQASTYRFTAESLTAGMTDGESAASIRGFLDALALTGIPQPLDYLIESTAARHGLVEVRADATTDRTAVTSADTALLQAIAVDQALRPLGLLSDGSRLTSRAGRDTVYWNLADARYPVVAIDATGEAEPVRRRTVDAPTDPLPTPGEVYAPLLARLRSGHGTEGESGWLERELEQAVRAKGEVEVSVRMPDGSERAFVLEATGLGGGRLRGRDRAADIERTLPVSHIVSVVPLGG